MAAGTVHGKSEMKIVIAGTSMVDALNWNSPAEMLLRFPVLAMEVAAMLKADIDPTVMSICTGLLVAIDCDIILWFDNH